MYGERGEEGGSGEKTMLLGLEKQGPGEVDDR